MRLLVRAAVPVEAPADVVFGYVTDWPRQREWIPLTYVRLQPGPQGEDPARHVGGRFRAWTGIGPVGFWDPITVTAWEEQPDGSGRCDILHTGRVVRGDAQFRVVARGPNACTATLWERLEVPGGPVGELLWRIVGRLVGPVLDRGAERVLRGMARKVERRDEAGR